MVTNKSESNRFFFITMLCLFFGIWALPVHAATVGQALENVNIKDANDNPAQIPFWGKKVLAIFYNDPDTADIGDPLADALKAKGFDKEKYQVIGIANCKDTWLPNLAIRMVVRGKIKKYHTVVLTDTDLTVPKKWDLGNCNNTCVVMIVGKDKRLKYIAKIKNKDQSRQLIPDVSRVIEKEIAAIK